MNCLFLLIYTSINVITKITKLVQIVDTGTNCCTRVFASCKSANICAKVRKVQPYSRKISYHHTRPLPTCKRNKGKKTCRDKRKVVVERVISRAADIHIDSTRAFRQVRAGITRHTAERTSCATRCITSKEASLANAATITERTFSALNINYSLTMRGASCTCAAQVSLILAEDYAGSCETNCKERERAVTLRKRIDLCCSLSFWRLSSVTGFSRVL